MAPTAPAAGAITTAHLEAKLRASLPEVVFIKAEDESDGCGSKFNVLIASTAFVGEHLNKRLPQFKKTYAI